jgi:hypothetical protein
MVRGGLIFTVILFLISILFLIATMPYPYKAKLFPLLTLLPALILLIVQIIREVCALKGVEALEKGKIESFNYKDLAICAWLLGTLVMLWLLGFMGTVILLPFLYLRFQRESWLLSITLSLGCGFFFYSLFAWSLHMSLYPGILFTNIFG